MPCLQIDRVVDDIVVVLEFPSWRQLLVQLAAKVTVFGIFDLLHLFQRLCFLRMKNM